MVQRCAWCNLKNPAYVAYHDQEWGVPRFDDAYLFEMLLLESFQAGLSWECILNKREAFRAAFDGFDARRVAAYGPDKIEELMGNAGIVRNRRKIEAAVTNARCFLDLAAQYGSFAAYLRTFTRGVTVCEVGLSSSPLSDALSADLRRHGMKFVGSTVIYAWLQAIGAVSSHDAQCAWARPLPPGTSCAEK